jgi:hypothetical protein
MLPIFSIHSTVGSIKPELARCGWPRRDRSLTIEKMMIGRSEIPLNPLYHQSKKIII